MEVKATVLNYINKNGERYPVCEFKCKGHIKQVISSIPDTKTAYTAGTIVVLDVNKNCPNKYVITDKKFTTKNLLATMIIILLISILCMVTRMYGITMYPHPEDIENQICTIIS